MSNSNYVIELDEFKGPANILLELVRKRKVDINKIKLSPIIQDFIDFIDLNKNILLDTISGFLYIASILLEIKSNSVIPSHNKLIVEDDFLTTDNNLLAEREKIFKVFNKISNYINRLKELEELHYLREASIEPQFLSILPDFLKDINIEKLRIIASKLINANEFVMDLSKIYIDHATINIINEMDRIKNILNNKNEVSFRELSDKYTLLVDKIVCFLSLLELYKNEVIDILQFESFGDILVRKFK